MRLVMAIVVAVMTLTAAPVLAAQLTGTLVSISPEEGRMLVMPSDRQAFITVLIPADRWPPGLQPGVVVSIEGTYSEKNRQLFLGGSISTDHPAPPSRRRDPTGVRSRLNRLQ